MYAVVGTLRHLCLAGEMASPDLEALEPMVAA